MKISEYFDSEYNFLQTAGEEFAERFPERGKFLRLSDRDRKDPFVERLFEGFSFLAGRIHERLDNDFPELAEGLLEQLFPHMLRPFPSCSIVSTKYRPGALTQPVTVPRGSEIRSGLGKITYKAPAGPGEQRRTVEKEEVAEFIFRTTSDLTIRPMQLKGVHVEDAGDGKNALIFRFQPERNVPYETLDLKTLSFFLDGPDAMKFNLLHCLTDQSHKQAISVRELNAPDSEFKKLPDCKIGISALSPELNSSEKNSAIVPFAQQSFDGYRLLHEYFSFPERFFFVEIEGLDRFEDSGEGHAFEVKIEFNRHLAREHHPGTQNILLHCAPIVNLFDSTTEASINQRMPEYNIIPDVTRRNSREIYSVEGVTGLTENGVEKYFYTPVTSTEILDSRDPNYNYRRFYSVIRRAEPKKLASTSLRFFGTSLEDEVLEKELLSVKVALSNGNLPCTQLDVGTIKNPQGFPPGVQASNISVPTEALECPEKKNFLWHLIAHLNLSYSTLAEKETLQKILRLYNWAPRTRNPNKKRIDAITKVHPIKPKSVMRNRVLLRGIEFHIEIDQAGFNNGAGDVFLFGTVLHRFLSQYVTINSFVFLKITDSGSEKEYTWEPTLGKISPI